VLKGSKGHTHSRIDYEKVILPRIICYYPTSSAQATLMFRAPVLLRDDYDP